MRVVAICSFVLWVGMASRGRGENPPIPAMPLAKAGQDQQIRCDIKVVEISLTKMRRQGLDFSQFGLKVAEASQPSTGGAKPAGSKQLAIAGSQVAEPESVASLLETLHQKNLLKVLAEPTLIAVDGRPAFFHAGGEMRLPIRRADGSTGSYVRRIGTQVDLKPMLLEDRKIRLHVRASQTEVDPSASVNVRGGNAPGFRTCEFDTDVEMKLGATAIYGGPVQQDTQVVTDPKTRRKSNVREESQIIFVITPALFAAEAE